MKNIFIFVSKSIRITHYSKGWKEPAFELQFLVDSFFSARMSKGRTLTFLHGYISNLPVALEKLNQMDQQQTFVKECIYGCVVNLVW